MIDDSLVTERFLMLASLSEADEKVQTLCQSASLKLERIVRENTDLDNSLIINAAAADAFYRWALINKAGSQDDFKSFRAGDITVQNDVRVSLDAAKAIRNEAFEAIADLLEDRAFYFGEVLINDVGPSF